MPSAAPKIADLRDGLKKRESFSIQILPIGLTVIGVQSPEFESEKSLDNIAKALKKHEIVYPIVTDNDMKTWTAYGVNAWPTIVILDKQGRIRYSHVGEGAYGTQENVIKTLLGGEEAEPARH